jgi:hypothetical protein
MALRDVLDAFDDAGKTVRATNELGERTCELAAGLLYVGGKTMAISQAASTMQGEAEAGEPPGTLSFFWRLWNLP